MVSNLNYRILQKIKEKYLQLIWYTKYSFPFFLKKFRLNVSIQKQFVSDWSYLTERNGHKQIIEVDLEISKDINVTGSIVWHYDKETSFEIIKVVTEGKLIMKT